MSIDDAGSYETPARHITIENCKWERINATGNNDELKLSGLDDFIIKNCVFKNGSPGGGSLIDMVGCHRGRIEENIFENGGSNSVQAKGGSKDILIQRNKFITRGERSINIGGSTGLPFFRPLGVKYEASSIRVYSNIIIGGFAPICFVGADNSEVINNTIVKPGKGAVRILQENVQEGFLPCGENVFRNNIVVTDNEEPTLNIGAGTNPESFLFSNNLWYNPENKKWIGPITPVVEPARIVNINPLLSDSTYQPEPNSPAIGKGYPANFPKLDFSGKLFRQRRSIGALDVK